jgi:hypothetical protein
MQCETVECTGTDELGRLWTATWNWVDNVLNWWATTSLLLLQCPCFMGLFYWIWVIKQQHRPACSTQNVINAVATLSSEPTYWPSPQHTCSQHTSRDLAVCAVHCALLCTTQCVLQRCSSWLRYCSTVNKYTETNFQPAADWTAVLCSVAITFCAGGCGNRQQTAERKVHCYADCKDVQCKCDVMQPATVIIPSWRKNHVSQRYGQSVKQRSFCCYPKDKTRTVCCPDTFCLIYSFPVLFGTELHRRSQHDVTFGSCSFLISTKTWGMFAWVLRQVPFITPPTHPSPKPRINNPFPI